jgi:phosphoglycolate phosphatase-like HAD superfamily hydrolase
MTRKKIFIDFDDVLFDTAKFKVELFDIFRKIGIPEDIIQKKYDEAGYPKACFKPLKMVNLIAEVTWNNPEMATKEAEKLNSEIANLQIDSYKYVMEGAKEFLESFDRQKYELIILTYGDKDFQNTKVEFSRLGPPLVDRVVPTEGSKVNEISSDILEGEQFIFIDDKEGQRSSVKNHFSQAEIYSSISECAAALQSEVRPEGGPAVS